MNQNYGNFVAHFQRIYLHLWPDQQNDEKCLRYVLEISSVNILWIVCPIEVILSLNERRVIRTSFHSVYNITRRKIRLLVGWWDFMITKISSKSGWKYFYLCREYDKEEFLFEECFVLDLLLRGNHAKQAIPVAWDLPPPTLCHPKNEVYDWKIKPGVHVWLQNIHKNFGCFSITLT